MACAGSLCAPMYSASRIVLLPELLGPTKTEIGDKPVIVPSEMPRILSTVSSLIKVPPLGSRCFTIQAMDALPK